MIQMFKYDCQVQNVNLLKYIKQIFNVKFPCYLEHLHDLSYILYTLLFSFILSYLCVCQFITITNPLITTNKAEIQCK